MYKFFEQIEEYLKQNDKLDIKDIIVNYTTSKLLRENNNFTYNKDYSDDNIYLSNECHLGDIILNNKKYRLLCDVSLDVGEINFN